MSCSDGFDPPGSPGACQWASVNQAIVSEEACESCDCVYCPDDGMPATCITQSDPLGCYHTQPAPTCWACILGGLFVALLIGLPLLVWVCRRWRKRQTDRDQEAKRDETEPQPHRASYAWKERLCTTCSECNGEGHLSVRVDISTAKGITSHTHTQVCINCGGSGSV